LVAVAGGGGEGALHDAAAIDGEAGGVEEADVFGLGVVEGGGTKESDLSAVNVERRETSVEEEVLELCRSEARARAVPQ
jgi:hypothetical protein